MTWTLSASSLALSVYYAVIHVLHASPYSDRTLNVVLAILAVTCYHFGQQWWQAERRRIAVCRQQALRELCSLSSSTHKDLQLSHVSINEADRDGGQQPCLGASDLDPIETLPLAGHSMQSSIPAFAQAVNDNEHALIIIPVLARTPEDVKSLWRAVDSVRPVPVVVIDDGSPAALKSRRRDDSQEGSHQREQHRVLLLRHSRNLGPGAARNTGWTTALRLGATSVLFMDADCEGSPAWARGMACLQREHGPCLLGGITRAHGTDYVSRFHDLMGTLNPRTLALQTQVHEEAREDEQEQGKGRAHEQVHEEDPESDRDSAGVETRSDPDPAMGSVAQPGGPEARQGEGRVREALYLPTCNMCAHVQVLQQAGGFDEGFPSAAFEDVEVCVRGRKRGVRVLLAVEGSCPPMQHHFDTSLVGFCQQFMRYGSSHPLMREKHPEYDDWYASSEEVPAGKGRQGREVDAHAGGHDKNE